MYLQLRLIWPSGARDDGSRITAKCTQPPISGSIPWPVAGPRAILRTLHSSQSAAHIIIRSPDVNITELETKSREDLAVLANDLGISGANTLRKQELIFRLLQAQTEQQG